MLCMRLQPRLYYSSSVLLFLLLLLLLLLNSIVPPPQFYDACGKERRCFSNPRSGRILASLLFNLTGSLSKIFFVSRLRRNGFTKRNENSSYCFSSVNIFQQNCYYRDKILPNRHILLATEFYSFPIAI